MRQLPGESDKAFLAFRCYFENGRTVTGAWEAYARETSLSSASPSSGFKQWVKKYDWQGRASAEDAMTRTATQAIAAKNADGNEVELVEFAIKVALGEKEITGPQATILKRLLDHALGKPSGGNPSSVTTNNTQVNVVADAPMSKDDILRAMRAK